MDESVDRAATLSLLALEGLPEGLPGMALAPLITAALQRHSYTPSDGDVLLVCQKVVSTSENRFVDLASVQVSAQAEELGELCGKDPRLVEIVLRESTEVVR